MFNFCPKCGGSIEQNQTEGQPLTCRHCGKLIGIVSIPKQEIVDQAQESIRSGTAARCPLCQHLIELKVTGQTRAFVPHFATGGQRKMCPNSGKQPTLSSPLPASVSASPPARKMPGGKDLSAYYTKEFIRVVACKKGAMPSIEELTLEYLDKADRVRIQIEALRDILGPKFRMQDYPAALNKPDFAYWGNPAECVVAKKHEKGGYQQMSDSELTQIVEDVKMHGPMFFG